MKKIFLAITVILLMANCEASKSQEISPEMAKFGGKWKLAKVVYGFRSPNGEPEFIPNYEEILEFNAAKGTYTRTKDGKVVEISSTKTSKLTDGSTSTKDAIVFEKDNTYSFYFFTENPVYLVLSYPVPVGAVLADGNSFYYQKIQ